MEFRAWMIQSAWEYIRAARLSWQHGLTHPAMVNAGIGLEILFKSFTARVHGPPGGIGEQYQTERGHDLQELFDAIPEEIRDRFAWQTRRDYFDDGAALLFVRSRYPYEVGALPGGCDAIIDIAEEMLGQVVEAYRRGGCPDPWIQQYPNG